MRKNPYQHDALRDTMWIGKGVGPLWLVILGVVAAAALANWLLR